MRYKSLVGMLRALVRAESLLEEEEKGAKEGSEAILDFFGSLAAATASAAAATAAGAAQAVADAGPAPTTPEQEGACQ